MALKVNKKRRSHLVGEALNYEGLVVAFANMVKVSEKDFFQEIEMALEERGLEQYTKEAMLIKNLKMGVTIGMRSFKIEDKRS